MKSPHEHLPENLAENIRFTWLRCLVPALFICLPLFLLIGSLVWPHAYAKHERKTTRFITEMESRYPAPLPSLPFSKAQWAAWPQAMDKYLSDFFPLRKSLVGMHSQLKYDLGISPGTRVVVGRQDWLFYGDNSEKNDIRGLNRMDPDHARDSLNFLNRLQDEMTRRGIVFLVVIAPNKSSIYPEMLPVFLQQKPSEKQGLDLWLSSMESGGRAPILDLRKMLREKKSEGQIYFKTDTHWNPLGAGFAAEEILDRLQKLGLPVKARGLKANDFGSEDYTTGDLARMMGLKLGEKSPVSIAKPKASVEKEEESRLKQFFPASNNQFATLAPSSAGGLLMIHDSFGDFLRPVFSEIFSPAFYVSAAATPKLEEILGAVDYYKPSVLIWERVERNLIVAPSP